MDYRGKPVCTQSQYWTQFGINFVAVIGLIGLAVFSLFSGSWGVAIIAFLALVPVGIWFRVVMMRRCRDIGWPTFLPWLFFGGGVALNLGRIGSAASLAAQPGMAGAAMAPLMLGLVDFGFMILIGCISSAPREELSRVFDDGEPLSRAQPAYRPEYAAARPAAAAPRPGIPQAETEQEARWDAAIAAALAARDQGQREVEQPGRPTAPPPAAGRPGGFGRRVV